MRGSLSSFISALSFIFSSKLQGLSISTNNRLLSVPGDVFQGNVSFGVVFGEDSCVLVFGPHVFEGRGAFFTCAFKGGFAESFPFEFFFPDYGHVKGFFCDRVCDLDVGANRTPFIFRGSGEVYFDFRVVIGD